TYQGGRTVKQKYFYPQNSTYTDLKMTESAFDFLKDNKIFIPIKAQTESGTNIIAGSISPLKAYSGAYHTHQLWSIKQGAWVLDGTYIDYSMVCPQYKVACYPIQYASDYSR
ncbi:MAG: hypothetical protein LC101_03890, partial [Flavobacteriales bacterium]|nr:hypothetical protein [Flavobacteriales bacterium]